MMADVTYFPKFINFLTNLHVLIGSYLLYNVSVPKHLTHLPFFRLVHLDLIMFGISSTLVDVLQLLPSLRTLSVWPVEVC